MYTAYQPGPVVVAASGRKQSGKSSLCDFLQANALALFGAAPAAVARLSMAGPLKRLCVDVLGLPPEAVYGDEAQKSSPTRYRWEELPHYGEVALTRSPVPGGPMTVREVMQEVGTGVFRRMWGDVWAEAAARAALASGAPVVLFDDARFPNEVAAVRGVGGAVLRLSRAPLARPRAEEHVSEWALDRDVFDWAGFDAVIGNDELGVAETGRLAALALYELGLVSKAGLAAACGGAAAPAGCRCAS